jgi:hypothetical protein
VTAGHAVALIDAHQLGDGPSVDYPESGRWENGRREWSLTTRWIDLTESLALTWAGVQLIQSIWKIGRYRTLGGGPTGDLFFPISLRPAQLRSNKRSPMQRMSWRLLAEERNDV